MGGLSMTREEQIIEAGIEYTMQNNPVCIGGDNFYEMAKMLNRNRSFEEGAKWANRNLDLSSLWHDAGEAPERREIILIEVVNTIVPKNEVRYFVEYVEEWIVGLMKKDGFKCRWAYINDLLPKN